MADVARDPRRRDPRLFGIHRLHVYRSNRSIVHVYTRADAVPIFPVPEGRTRGVQMFGDGDNVPSCPVAETRHDTNLELPKPPPRLAESYVPEWCRCAGVIVFAIMECDTAESAVLDNGRAAIEISPRDGFVAFGLLIFQLFYFFFFFLLFLWYSIKVESCKICF